MPEPIAHAKINPKMYEELKESLSKIYGDKSVERTSKEITRKGYDTTGYGYQFVVNRLNEVITKYGLYWTTQDEIQLKREYPTKSGQINYEYAGRLSILILDDTRQVVDARHCYGGHQSATHADAMKGAFTNAFKKTAALLGVGADAYEGTIDEDYRPVEEPAKEVVTEAVMGLKLTGAELKAIEKELTAVSGVTNKEESKSVETLITGLVGKVSGKQIAFLRKALANKLLEL
jgi:hypothetical protein